MDIDGQIALRTAGRRVDDAPSPIHQDPAVVVLTGARQTGKTSTLRRLFPQYGFVSLDLPTEAEQAERDSEAFLRRHPPPLIIDEAQYTPAVHESAALRSASNRSGAHRSPCVRPS